MTASDEGRANRLTLLVWMFVVLAVLQLSQGILEAAAPRLLAGHLLLAIAFGAAALAQKENVKRARAGLPGLNVKSARRSAASAVDLDRGTAVRWMRLMAAALVVGIIGVFLYLG